MKSGLLIFTLAALFPTPSDARNCTDDDNLVIGIRSLGTSKVTEKCAEESRALGFLDDISEEQKKKICELQSCIEAGKFILETFGDLPVCTFTDGRSLIANMLEESPETQRGTEEIKICNQEFADKFQAIVDKKSDEADDKNDSNKAGDKNDSNKAGDDDKEDSSKAENNSNGATSTSVMATLTTLLIVATAQYTLL